MGRLAVSEVGQRGVAHERTVERRYRLGARLGAGSTAEVYEAFSLGAALASHGKRRVALKVLAREHAGDTDAIARFTHEAYLGTRVRHSALVRVLDFGWLEPGRPYAVMELSAGATLDRILSRTHTLPPTLVCDLIDDAASGLATLHRAGIVHRDLKPSNLFAVQRTGRRPKLRLLGLGIATVYDMRRARRLRLAEAHARGTYGTPAYIAPEQALGLRVDPRADVYALACVAYRMLLGVDAFRATTVENTV